MAGTAETVAGGIGDIFGAVISMSGAGAAAGIPTIAISTDVLITGIAEMAYGISISMTATDNLAGDIKKAQEAAENTDVSKGGSKTNLPKTEYTKSKLQHEYKHAEDFGVEGNWNNNKAKEYQKAIQKHIDNAPDVYKSKYRGEDVYVYLNEETSLGAYVDMNGNYIGGWKFNSKQINYHLTNGVKIK
ncbi:colicin D domain-containing protein [Lachnotalea glycerini]|uniref:colicin D domain-containing protein n=1 Tax=Lachnotalea glycerini TaxID=1763509 RepID=UPI000BD3B94C|nr:colicin D domain-containing protein [Lachnotalea glycerini]